MLDQLTFPVLELTGELRFILDLGIAVAAALIGGAIAVRLGQPAIVGYLIAGIFIGPSTPGFVGDVERIAVLADVGVVLLLFALGVEFSIRELRAIRRVALPGGVAQIAIVLVVGAAVMLVLGSDLREALVVGMCLSISSTLVVLKTLLDRGELDSLHGRAAIGWTIVQDIATIVFIVSLPPMAGGDVIGPYLLAIAKAAVFLVLAFVVGTRLFPWIFATVARLGSNELFLMAVVATALLTAFVSSAVFGLSLALGAFVAGLVVSESDLSHQVAGEVVPFRDLFAVLFFVSVGMLVDPAALLADVGLVAVLVVIAVVGKGFVTAALGRGLGLPVRSAVLLGATMAQVGEFSFILAEDGLELGLISERAYNLVLGTAVVSILVGSLATRVGDRVAEAIERRRDALTPVGPLAPGAAGAPTSGAATSGVATIPAATTGVPTTGAATSGVPTTGVPTTGVPTSARPRSRSEDTLDPGEEARRPSVVVLGAGRVGRVVIKAVRRRGFRCVVVDRDPRRLEGIAELGAITVFGDAANPEILRRLGLDRAQIMVVAIGDPLTERLATERALRINPRLSIAARARGIREIEALRRLGANRVADPEAEAAFELARHAMQRMGVSSAELSGIVSGLRRDVYGLDRR
jgi:CPA2 family monovalent cation:H+ antiporter-2